MKKFIIRELKKFYIREKLKEGYQYLTITYNGQKEIVFYK